MDDYDIFARNEPHQPEDFPSAEGYDPGQAARRANADLYALSDRQGSDLGDVEDVTVPAFREPAAARTYPDPLNPTERPKDTWPDSVAYSPGPFVWLGQLSPSYKPEPRTGIPAVPPFRHRYPQAPSRALEWNRFDFEIRSVGLMLLWSVPVVTYVIYARSSNSPDQSFTARDLIPAVVPAATGLLLILLARLLGVICEWSARSKKGVERFRHESDRSQDYQRARDAHLKETRRRSGQQWRANSKIKQRNLARAAQFGDQIVARLKSGLDSPAVSLAWRTELNLRCQRCQDRNPRKLCAYPAVEWVFGDDVGPIVLCGYCYAITADYLGFRVRATEEHPFAWPRRWTDDDHWPAPRQPGTH